MAKRSVKGAKRAEVYEHEDQAVLRPEVGTQAQFKKRRPPKKYRYDSSLSPALEWDGQNPARELAEWLLALVEEASLLSPPHRFPEPRRFGDVEVGGLGDTVAALKALGRPFLDWSGKAERASFDVPTLPLFVHERLSTKAILETLKAHERDRQMELQLFGDPQLSLSQQLEAYEHTGGWVNRMILGDSLVVMNSLLDYEGLGGQFQMIYIDPPYAVRYGSNFQPFVRRREVRDGDDASMTREPEMVKAYRDTWELGLHSYLTYLRDRLFLARDLLASSGSIFVQINDVRVHHVREVMDEVFGEDNFVSQIVFQTTQGFETGTIATLGDFLLWYARDKSRVKVRKVFEGQVIEPGGKNASWLVLPDGTYRGVKAVEKRGEQPLPAEAELYAPDNLVSQGSAAELQPFEFDGNTYHPPANSHWKAHYPQGMKRLAERGRIHAASNSIRYRRFVTDFPFEELGNIWTDTSTGQFTADKIYVVQTPTKVAERCILLTTDPGDLVFDPTCGSGTTAYLAEQWGRRWITVDTSRVPLALARQRLLTGTFAYYELQDPGRGPASGFVYKRRQNRKGQEIGGIVPHITLESIANEEPPKEEVLVDRPDVNGKVTRVTGPFCVEATIPTPLNGEGEADGEFGDDGSFTDRMVEVLRRNPALQLGGNRTITLANVRPPAKSLTIAAEAGLEGNGGIVALVFGPENGAISERLVYEGAREAHARSYKRVILIGFAIEAAARELVEKCEELVGIPATYVQATPDLVMGDLLKTMRSSQIFSVTGLPDVGIKRLPPEERGGPDRYQVELRGLDVFDPTTMTVDHRAASDVPAWLLDTDYNELCFLVSQAFFPRTSAWENLKRALKGDLEDSVWEHLAGTTSAPFIIGERRRVAVKVIDDRGNELLVVKSLDESK
jgi:adenine-specific DNA-methyltransferase